MPDVPVEDVLLDVGNPRIRTGQDQRHCIERILRKEDHLLALTRDIAEKGLTTMPLIVKPNGHGQYVVMDGNRRVTALKLLNDPDKCPDERLKPLLRDLRKKYSANIPTAVDVLASSNDEAIAREVLARHSGEQGGVGQVNWSAYLRTVYLINHGHPPDYKRPGQYALWSEQQGIFVDDEFPITSLQRFFTLDNLALLGFKVERDELQPTMAAETVKRMAQILMTDFETDAVKVDDVRTPDLARTYITTVRARVGLEQALAIPSPAPPASSVASAAGVGAAPGPTTGPGGTPTAASVPALASPTGTTAPRAAPSPRVPAWERKQLLGRAAPNLAVPTSETKACTIIAEIRELDVRKTSLAAAMLMRHLIELSDEYYRAAKKLPDKGKLAKNVLASATTMRDSAKISPAEFDIASRLATPGSTELLHIETLQKVMHRDSHHPNYQLVNTFPD